MNRKDDDWELEELDLEEEPEGQAWQEPDDWEEEPVSLKPGAILLIFLGLTVLAAIICGILWNVTHRDRGDEETVEYSAEMQEESLETVGQDEAESSSEGTGPEAEEGQEAESSSEGANPDPEEGATSPSYEGTGPDSRQEEPESSTAASEEPSSEAVPDTTASPAETTEDGNRVSTKDGRVIVFTDCDDTVSPKEYVNLRLEPSTSEGNSTVHCRLNYGETVHRTGISEDSGWSRVEKDGVVCYVVTSLIYVVE